jgi:hypothetical protein
MECSLCSEKMIFFYSSKHKEYFFCTDCTSISLNENNRLNADEEKKHYEHHQNDVNDPRYQKFVSPIVEGILKEFLPTDIGLDFGSGTGPVITKMLTDKDYTIKTYDFFFDNNPNVLVEKYNYIACCEVVEHFFNPKKEFQLLYNLLQKGGKLYCMTEIYCPDSNFDTWYYKTDPTHVFFYSKKTFEWIKENYRFSEVVFDGRLIVLTK